MFPRPQERWALADAVEEQSGFPQFWDDERIVSADVKSRIAPAYEGDTPWDVFVVFDASASWASAPEHVLGWGAPVIDRREELESLLKGLARG